MFAEFRTFIMRGNVLDLAVAVIIGAAFGTIVTSFTDDLIMPLIAMATGGLDFSSKFIVLGDVPASYAGSLADYAALKKAGVPLFGYGKFLTTVINFRHHCVCYLHGDQGRQSGAQARGSSRRRPHAQRGAARRDP